ncbi:MAG: DUF1292 domain-containing protein [Tissierellales bacterium]
MTDNKKNDGCCCGNEHEHDHEGCGCGHDHEEMEIMTLSLDDGTDMECQVLGVFSVEDQEYIALLPVDEDNVLLYKYSEAEEGVELENIEDDNEYELVVEAFYELFGDDEDDHDDDEEDDEE